MASQTFIMQHFEVRVEMNILYIYLRYLLWEELTVWGNEHISYIT